MNMNLKQKNDSDCNFYHISLLVPYPNKFLVVHLCILIFHGIYLPPPPTTNIFLYWGELISFLGEWARPFSFIQNYLFHVCILTFLTFSREFSVQEFFVFSSVHSNSQKGVYYCLVITLRV